MGLFNRFKRKKNEKRNVLTDPNSWLAKAAGGYLTESGTRVNETNVLGISTVYACVRLYAWTIASMPIHVYKRIEPRGKEKAYDNELYYLLHDSPNPEQTAFQFKSLMSTNQNLWGAGIAEIERENGVPKALWPIPPWCVTPRRTPGQQLLVYEVNAGGTIYKPYQKIDGSSEYLWPDDVLVFPAFGSSRDEWQSPISTHRETLGFAKALKSYGFKTIGQGTNPAGIVSVDTPLTEQAEKDLMTALKSYSGLSNSSRLMYLNAGVKFERVGLPPIDAQFLDSERFTVAEIARIFNVPLFLLNEVDTAAGNGLEEKNYAFVSYSLQPYLIQWQQEFVKKLFDSGFKTRRSYFPEFCVESLLRGRLLDRYKAYSIGRQHTFLSPDDIREKENWNPLPNGQGDRYDTPINMANVDIIDKIQEKTAENGGDKENNPGSTKQQKQKKQSGGQEE